MSGPVESIELARNCVEGNCPLTYRLTKREHAGCMARAGAVWAAAAGARVQSATAFRCRYGFTAPTAQLPEDTRDPMPEDREEGLHCQRLSQRSPLAQSLARNPTIPQSAARMRSSASARRTSEAHHVHLVHHRLSAVAGS